MKAFIKTKYGGPEILSLQDVESPLLQEDQLLVKVMANSANPADWHLLRGKPYFARLTSGLFKPKEKIPGADFAGVVVKTGKDVTRFKPGDKVFGETLMGGAFAEYVNVDETVCEQMPEGVTFSVMAGVPVAGLTALQGLITHGKLKKGETVLINGSSGGVGHFAVQIAKAHGAIVTAVCSGKNLGFVKSLGADHVIVYDQENIHLHSGQYDLVIDTNGNLRHEDFQRMGKRGVTIGFTTMGHMLTLLLKSALSKFPLAQFTAKANSQDLKLLASLIKDGKVHPHIEKSYTFQDIPVAIQYIETMRTKGKVVMVWD